MTKMLRFRPMLDTFEERVVPSTLDLSGVEFRTIEGTGNNEFNPNQGAAETRQIRFGYGSRFIDPATGLISNSQLTAFGDYIIGDAVRANPRTISNTLMSQSTSIPSARLLTDWSFQWGQWLTHDLDLTGNGAQFNVRFDGTTGDFRIVIEDPNDPLYNPNNPFISFNRSQFDVGTGVPGQRRETVNHVTSYIDASNVYGSDGTRADALRTFVGGKLAMGPNNLLPTNTAGLPNADQFGAGAALFLAGDVRANEQVGLTTVHTLFVREHNRLADRIADLYQHLSDEEIFQFARRLVGAQQQVITYEEYLPAVFGFDLALNPYDANYDVGVNASVTNAFAHALFRFGHSEVNNQLLLVNNANQTVGTIALRDAFFNPDFLKNNPGNIDLVLKGLASQVGQEIDVFFSDGIRNNLFGPPGAGGTDLASLDIQRGRDHGLPDYNNLRNAYGLTPVTSFAEITSNVALQQKLEQLYGNVNNIDAIVGALAEDHLPGASVGPLLHANITNQFLRLMQGDRFFYANDPFLDLPEVKAVLDVKNVRLSDIIRWNTGVTNIQDNVFFDRSVLFYEAPDAGANISLVAAGGVVTLINNDTLQVIALRPLSSVQSVVLVGSRFAPDVFNLFIAGANGGIENGVSVFGGGGLSSTSSANDVVNVFGRLLTNDTFIVSSETVGANTTSADDTDVILERSSVQNTITVNGSNEIVSQGFETTRIVTLGGGDVVVDPDLIAMVKIWWNPLNDD